MTSKQLALFPDDMDSPVVGAPITTDPPLERVAKADVPAPCAAAEVARLAPPENPAPSALARPKALAGTRAPERIVLTVMEVARRYGVSRATIWRWKSAGLGFPAPVQLSKGTTRWYRADLDAYDARHRAALAKGGRQ